MIIVGLEFAIYSQILKCERSGQNLIFNNIEEAEQKAEELRKARGAKARGAKVAVVSIETSV